jgi:trigger factor
MAAVKTTVTELGDSRVRVEAEVGVEEIERRMNDTARRLGQGMKMPGFRKGHIPPPVVIQRVGREAVLDEAVRSTIGRWYVDALDDAAIHPVGDPDIDLGDLPPEGQPLTFSIEIGVRPPAQLGDYKGVDVARREPAAPPEAVDAELEALRERAARLEPSEEPAATEDFVVIDYAGRLVVEDGDDEPFAGGEGRDQPVQLGSGQLIPGFEDQLIGAVAGDEREVRVSFPDDYGAEHLAGRDAAFAVTVKQVQRKELPELDDDFASDAAGFDTLAELREDIEAKLREADERRVEGEFREAALDAVVASSTVTVPPALVQARANELWERMLHSLSHQGITKEAYLQIADKTEEAILAEAAPEAEQQLRREAVLAAVIEAEQIDPSDGDLLDALQAPAAREDTSPEKLLARLEKAGRLDELREDLAQRAAVDLIAEHATPIDPERAKARERIWTPGKD